ncbi:MAG: hypothetical protein J3K34DRAFT_428580 [Monoraphidium minutum]|nr:MAG: hypothetical protein J3K34DRAFT_428580 [Monoraphidium minutum]
MLCCFVQPPRRASGARGGLCVCMPFSSRPRPAPPLQPRGLPQRREITPARNDPRPCARALQALPPGHCRNAPCCLPSLRLKRQAMLPFSLFAPLTPGPLPLQPRPRARAAAAAARDCCGGGAAPAATFNAHFHRDRVSPSGPPLHIPPPSGPPTCRCRRSLVSNSCLPEPPCLNDLGCAALRHRTCALPPQGAMPAGCAAFRHRTCALHPQGTMPASWPQRARGACASFDSSPEVFCKKEGGAGAGASAPRRCVRLRPPYAAPPPPRTPCCRAGRAARRVRAHTFSSLLSPLDRGPAC